MNFDHHVPRSTPQEVVAKTMALPLPLDEVRRLAQETGLREVEYNDTSRVIAFLSDDGTRFNVYYTTGTVGTYVFHPRQGTTQLFRRNVSLALLKEIFRSARIQTDFGYHRREVLGSNSEQWKLLRTMNGEWAAAANLGEDLADEEESAARKQLEKLLDEKSMLEREILEVRGIIGDHDRRRGEKRKREQEEREEARRLEEARAREARKKRMRIMSSRRVR